jgi:Ni,Fe-hydrogenase III component G
MNGLPDCRTIPAAELPAAVERFHDEGWRFVTATAVPRPGAWTLIYHFEREEVLSHLRIEVGLTEAVPAIDRSYPAAFLVENEISELQGVRFSDLSIDYGGRLYRDFDGPEGWVHVRAPGSGESVAPICAAGERER